jgi:hypothetical protein
MRLEQVRPHREAFLARGRLLQAIDDARNDARRRDVLVRLRDRARAVVGPFGKATVDAAIGGEIEVREDADWLPARGRQRLVEGVIGG